MRKKYKVLLAFDTPYMTKRGYDFKEEFKDPDWATESDVNKALKELGYEVSLVGVFNNIDVLLEEIRESKPDMIFNLIEVFNKKTHFDKNIVAFFEMLGIPYTGASLSSLFICGDKALSKKILRFHRIKVPRFYTFYKGRRIWLPKRLRLPLIVKPLLEEASRGIAQASVVDNEEALIERVKFLHESKNMDAIAEEYIEGRELYVSVLGTKRLKVLPSREMKFGEFPDDEPRIATYKAKWDYEYRQKWGIKNVFSGRLPNGVDKKIEDICKRAYQALNMECYARFDIRVTPSSQVYIIEANANPCLAKYDELAQSAEKAGFSYPKLIQKIIQLALQRS
ncbi:MAG: ATP-grasp domain-containing protein [Candidatus Omnitrophota bacterium]|nr:MAG: ATP-grasp domain-containing protein [Candidatus Omnitrophota bacterium]